MSSSEPAISDTEIVTLAEGCVSSTTAYFAFEPSGTASAVGVTVTPGDVHALSVSEKTIPANHARKSLSAGVARQVFRISSSTSGRSLKPAGSSPVNSVLLFRNNPSRLVKFSVSAGIFPLNRLLPRFNSSRLVKFPVSVGMAPLKELELRSNSSRLAKFPVSAGMAPLKELELRSNTSRLVKFPVSAGISPLNRLLLRFNSSRLARFPVSAGMAPLKELELRSNT